MLIDALRLALQPDTPTAAASNAQRLASELENSAGTWHLGRGTYYLANPVPMISNFSGALGFSPGASLVFTNPNARGLEFVGGENAYFLNVRASFDPMPSRRVDSREAVAVYGAVRPRWERFVLHGSAAAGLLHCNCERPVVIDAVVSHTRADGVHFCNSIEPEARGIRTNMV